MKPNDLIEAFIASKRLENRMSARSEADLIGRGVEDRCECHPRPTGVNFVMDERSIIFCPICAGIEAGQATEADYHVTPFDDGRDEPQDITATELLRQARLAKRQRLQEAT